jgi:hypothetical protein
MSNGSIILVEEVSPFSPISQLHYQFYKDKAQLESSLSSDSSIQHLVGSGNTAFGKGQLPEACKDADNVSTMHFLLNLK